MLFLCVFSQSFFCFSQLNSPDTTLLIVGTFNLKNNLVRDIHVNLFVNEKMIDSTVASGNQVFGFYLKRNLLYTIEIYKEGYTKKTIGVSTKLSDDIQPKAFFSFVFQIPLERIEDEEEEETKTNHPVAIVYYNDELDKFDYGVDSTKKLYKKKKKRK